MADKKAYLNRLSRMEGQLRGIGKMVEEDRACPDVVTQLMAVRAAMDKMIHLMVTENLLSCVQGQEAQDPSVSLEEALKLLFKSKS